MASPVTSSTSGVPNSPSTTACVSESRKPSNPNFSLGNDASVSKVTLVFTTSAGMPRIVSSRWYWFSPFSAAGVTSSR